MSSDLKNVPSHTAKQNDVAALNALYNRARADQLQSRDLLGLDYLDTTVFTEQWANLTSWGSPATLQVSGGKLFTVTTGGGPGANHSWAVPNGNGISTPNAPTLGASSGGNLAAGVYSVRQAQGNADGETQPSAAATVTVTANQKIDVTLQAMSGQATYTAIYLSTIQDGNGANERLAGIVTSGTTFTIGEASPAAITLNYPTPTKLPSLRNRTGTTPAGVTRIVGSINLVAGTAGGYTLVGVSRDTAGGAFTSGAANLLAIGFNTTGIPVVYNSAGASTGSVSLGVSSAPAGTYTVFIDVSETTISLTLTDTAGHEWVAQVSRTVWTTINNLSVYISDSRTTSGNSIGPLGARLGKATITPRTGVEGITRTSSYQVLGNRGARSRVWFPTSLDSRKASPLVLCFHPFGGSEGSFTAGNAETLALALTNAGYIVGSVGFTQEECGNQSLIDAMQGLYRYLRDTCHIGPVGLLPLSMGGIGAQIMLSQKRVPALALYGVVPVCSLAAVYADVTNFQAGIKTAYSIVSDGSNYAAQTLNHDPLLRPASDFVVPMRFIYSSADTLVPPAQHCLAQAARLRSGPAEITTVDSHGATGHSDSANYQGADAVMFFNRHLIGT